MNRAAVAHQVRLRHDKLLERSVDGVKVDIGEEAVDAGVDARRLWPVHITVHRNQIGQQAKIGEPAGVSLVRCVAPDARKIVALTIASYFRAYAVFSHTQV